MKASDLRRLIGKTVTFKSDRTSWLYTCPTNTGIVIEVVRTEVYIAGDWHNIKTIEIIKVHEEEAII